MTPATIPNRYEEAEVIKTIKETVCKGATDAQLKMFLEVCRATGLNPFLKEVWFVPSVGIMAARDGYLRVANENPQFDGMETRVDRDANNMPVKAVCTVWRKDRMHPIICEAYFNEYVKTSSVWKQYPSAMISKVAEVLALKRSFAINGVVTEEEIGNEQPAAGWEGSGTKEAARAKGEEIIATLNAGEPYRGPVPTTEKLLEASIDKAKEQKGETKATPKSKNYKMLKEFREIRKQYKDLGWEANYYGILGEFGVCHSNEFPETPEGTKAARQCYRAMGKDLGTLREFLRSWQFHEESGNWREVK